MVLKAFVLDAVVIPSSSMEKTLLPGDFILVNKLNYEKISLHGGNNVQAVLPFLPSLIKKSVQPGDVIVFNFPAASRKTILNENDLLVKRCIAKSGDVVQIHKGKLLVNDSRVAFLPFQRDGEEKYSSHEFFPPSSNYTFHEYGPVRVPKKGDIIHLTKESFAEWKNFIRAEGHSVSESSTGNFFIDGKQQLFYIVEKNYLFTLGDNYYHSYDSRFWGFLPEENVVGKAAFVYWSLDSRRDGKEASDLFKSVRWDRIGTLIR